MLKTVFVWLFIAVPLASAIGLIGYRMRTFLLVVGLIILGAAGIWGTLRLGSVPDGWWDLTAGEFLGRWGNPLAYDYHPLVPWPFARAATGVPALLALFFGLAAVAAPVVAEPTPRSVATACRILLVLVWGAFAAAYGFCFALWLLNKLIFWSF